MQNLLIDKSRLIIYTLVRKLYIYFGFDTEWTAKVRFREGTVGASSHSFVFLLPWSPVGNGAFAGVNCCYEWCNLHNSGGTAEIPSRFAKGAFFILIFL